ncbi:hypothetical protein [Hymenobacter sp. BT190]|uniref:hypothetical protein n=1 Tax=Hymenobacter sp. BT190 TaxID=2763505 RepID=UPI001650EDCB|nr:hypothetical protein [Hymenobacter sp. BT190]MBC6696603.1 hypothetical protein [Hymenobacter sp. BT190]
MRYCYPLLLLAVSALSAQAQTATSPTITRTDMPVPSDTLRQSTAAVQLPASAPPLSRRGPNQTWNYSGLTATAQNVARFTTVPNQPLYTFTFNSALSGANRATVASPQAVPVPPGFALPVTDPYQFFNASVADFRSVGYGGTLAGTAVPVTYASASQQDIIYRFPLSYASPADSSNSFFSISVPGTGYLSQRRKRVNKADAWGMLTTPFGTFQTVRVVTRLEDHDSVSVGTTSQGFDLPVRREYKWLATGQRVPLLTITTAQVGGQEVVSNVEYRDIYRRIVLKNGPSLAETALQLYPNPGNAQAALHLARTTGGAATITATDLAGRRLFQYALPPAVRQIELPATLFGSFRGVAVLHIQTPDGVAVRRVVRQ